MRAYLVCCMLLLTAGPVCAGPALTLLPAKEEKTLRCELRETERGLQAMIRFAAPGKPAGGDYQLSLDGLPLAIAQFQGALAQKVDIPVNTISNGQHTLRCEVHASSGEHAAERPFLFDGSPSVTLTGPFIDKNGLLDATISLRFFGSGTESAIGFLEVLIDERPMAQVRLTNKQSNATPLSRLLGKGIALGQLPVGTHLLTLRGVGINGAATLARASFTVEAPPDLVFKKDKQGKILAVQARFLPVDAGYPGRVDVLLDQDLLVSRRAEKETEVVITRDELLAALKKRDLLDDTRPVVLVFVLRAMNGSERWQVVEFIP
jgi:hypothetical protein